MTKRFVFALLLLSFAIAVLATSCSEPAPGEVGGKVTKNGQPFGATIKAVQNGNTVAESQSIDGVYFIDNLPPGEYTIQCWTRAGELLKEDTATIEPEGSTNLNFNLDG